MLRACVRECVRRREKGGWVVWDLISGRGVSVGEGGGVGVCVAGVQVCLGERQFLARTSLSIDQLHA